MVSNNRSKPVKQMAMLRIKVSTAAIILLSVLNAAQAQQQSDTEAVLSANAAFDSAISQRDMKAMAASWAKDDRVVALHPRAKNLDIGWEAVRKSWEAVFDRFAELSVHMQQPIIRIHGGMALITGVEVVQGRRKNGDPVSYSAFTINAFEKRDEGWVMTLHSAAMVPKD